MALLFFSLSANNLFLQFSFLFLLLSYFLYQTSGIQQQICNDGDRSSLLQFKESFVFDEFSCDPSTDYTKLSSWKDVADDDCCSWDGVDCDDQTGHVIGLDLSRSCLYGSIKSSSPLFRLVHLTSLDLSLNNFNLSTISGGLRSLSELKHLDLSSANFSSQIPSEVLKLSQLVSLRLGENQLMLHKPSLEDVVEKLTNLAELELNGVNISSHIPHSFSNLTTLSSLLLQNCSLHGEFPTAIFQLPNLRLLNLRYNSELTGYLPEFQVGSPLERLGLDRTNFSGQLPLSIGNLRSLSYFSAERCGFRGTIPSSIGNLTKLDTLSFSENYFTGNIPSSSLGNLFQLKYLSLSDNNFNLSLGNTLHWIGKLTNLQYLDLANTNLYGVIPSSLANLTQLQWLALRDNQFNGQLHSWLANSTQLRFIYLARNDLQGPIPDSIFRLPNIQSVELQSNNLSGSLRFGSFLQSKYLSVLQLSGNHLSLVKSKYMNVTDLPKFQSLGLGGCDLREFPAFLRGQHQLEYLELNRNNIKGYAPSWIFNFIRLRFLSLQENSLKGFEHSPSFNLTTTNLQYVDLSANEFEGPLPIPPHSISFYAVAYNSFSGDVSPLFCNLTSLLLFDLSNNNLSGNLPLCLGNLASSTLVLSIRNNTLSGKIPDTLTSGCVSKVMDFSQNSIEGEVPRSLANCSNLEILNLEANQMNDVFPSWLGILPRLRILSLRSNKFHGAIRQPLTKFEFNRLQIIDLSHNNFSGKLPSQYFRNSVAMKSVDDDRLAYMKLTTSVENTVGYNLNVGYPYFIRIVIKGSETSYDKILEFFVVVDLSSNRFEGEIPEIIGTLKELQSLNLSNNILTGHIPSSLGNLTNLQALDLSLNKLSGDIPTKLSLLTFLSIFNVSHNNLTGLVPQGNQFGTFENDSFSANPGLCGTPLSRKCGDTGTTLSLPPSEDEDEDEESPFELYWEIMLAGFGSGLVIGVSWGYAMDTRKYEWLVRRKFARRRRRRRMSRTN